MDRAVSFSSGEFFRFRLPRASILVLTAAAVLPTSAYSADFNVPSGTTVTTTQTLTDTGDTGTVEMGGAIDTTGVDAVVMQNTNQLLTNNGSITTTGAFRAGVFASTLATNARIINNGTIFRTDRDAYGIFSNAGSATIVNNSTFTTSGRNSVAIVSRGNNSTITNNGTLTATGSLSVGIGSVGDNDQVTNNGTIQSTGTGLAGQSSSGIEAFGDNAVISNTGTIMTNGLFAWGILTGGSGITITNSGTVSTSGDDAEGISTGGDNTAITNTGTVMTAGDFSYGIEIDGMGSSATNSGTISTTGDDAHGIEGDADSLTVTNTNRITVTGEFSDAIDIDGDNANASNTGSISAAGTQGDGIDLNGDNATANNSGTISVSGPAANGIEVTGTNASVVNSGGVFSQNGSSFSLESGNAALTLNPGSVIQGIITYLDPATSSFTFSAERTAILTFAGLPNTIGTGSLPSWISGSTLTVVDPQDFRLDTTDDVLNALTGGIADAVGDHLHNGRRSSGAGGLVATSGGPASPVATTYLAPPGISVWGSLIGNVLSRSGSNGFDHYSAGLLAGIDKDLSATSRGGVFGGFSLGRTDGGSTAYTSDTVGAFLGGYWSALYGDNFLDLMAAAGYLGSDDEVTILNNLVPGGLQNISLGYNSLFISPSATVGHVMGLEDGSKFEPSLRLRYSGLFQLNSANETTTRFSVADRMLHVLEVRGQIAHDFAPKSLEAGALHFGLKAGVDGIFNLGGSQNASLNGAAINLSVSDDDAVARGFARADLRLISDPATELSASLEGGYDTAATVSARARIGFVRRF